MFRSRDRSFSDSEDAIHPVMLDGANKFELVTRKSSKKKKPVTHVLTVKKELGDGELEPDSLFIPMKH